jgi:hypothetical protein
MGRGQSIWHLAFNLILGKSPCVATENKTNSGKKRSSICKTAPFVLSQTIFLSFKSIHLNIYFKQLLLISNLAMDSIICKQSISFAVLSIV